jgi:hypothetical protein
MDHLQDGFVSIQEGLGVIISGLEFRCNLLEPIESKQSM